VRKAFGEDSVGEEGFDIKQYPFKEEEYMAVLKDVLDIS